MTRLLLCTATILALTASYAGAHEPSKKELNDKKEANENWIKHGIKIQEFTRYVISGKSVILYFEHALDENCSQGEFDARVLKYPEQGTIELVAADGQANFPKDNVRSKCNGKKVKGINIIYKSSPEYAGPDNVHVITFASSGFAIETHWRLNVVR